MIQNSFQNRLKNSTSAAKVCGEKGDRMSKEERVAAVAAMMAQRPELHYHVRYGLSLDEAADGVMEHIEQALNKAHPDRHTWAAEDLPWLSTDSLYRNVGAGWFCTREKFTELLEHLVKTKRVDVLRSKFAEDKDTEFVWWIREVTAKT
jgi:hypothetical protein